MLTPRRGSTLIELTVSLALGALVLLVVMALGTRQQRLYQALGQGLADDEQLDQGAAILPLELRMLSTALGDVPPGGATDTTLEFRATLVSAVVCAVNSSGVVLAPASTGSPHLGSYLDTPVAGDTAWVLLEADSTDTWVPVPVISVRTVGGTTGYDGCAEPWSRVLTTRDKGIALGLGGTRPTPDITPGVPVRITRRARYSFYRSGNGSWYFGYREWNANAGTFDQVQPVSGPYASPRAGRAPFRYFDSRGNPIDDSMDGIRDLAWIEAELIPQANRARGGAHDAVRSGGSITIVVAPRNRR